jgi:hypothetical protein
MPSKKIFSHAEIVTPENANGWQNPTFVSRKDFPDGTTQWDLQEGEYFTPQVHIEKDLIGFNEDSDTYLSGSGVLTSPWGGRVTDKPLGYAHTPPFHTVDVAAGCIIDTEGVKRCWNASPVQVTDGQVSYIYVDNAGTISVGNSLPGRIVPHTALAKITASGDLTQVEDLRPHAATGAHNDTPLQLINTEVKTADYEANTWERVLVDTAGGTFTIFLPDSPSDGDVVGMLDIGGVLASFPVVIASKKTIIGEIAVANQAINQETKDWVFNSNYMYISLVWSESQNSWFFQEVPDGNCDPAPGAFIRCGGAHPTIDSPEACLPPFTWNSNRQQCIIRASYGVYASKNQGEIFYVQKDKRCRCANRLDPSAECFEEKGEFLRCDGNGNAFYADGDGGEVKILEDNICFGGSRKGDFVQCDGNDALFVRDNNPDDDHSIRFRIRRHPRCMQGEAEDESHLYAKKGFIEDFMQPVIDYKRVGSGNNFNESGNDSLDDEDTYSHVLEGGFGSSAENGRVAEYTIVKWNDHPNIDEAAWARIRVSAKCTSNPCAVRTRVFIEYPRGSADEVVENLFWASEVSYLWTPGTGGIGFNSPGAANIIWIPLTSDWKRFKVRYRAWGAKAAEDESSASVTFFTRRQQLVDRHYNDY